MSQKIRGELHKQRTLVNVSTAQIIIGILERNEITNTIAIRTCSERAQRKILLFLIYISEKIIWTK
jgi:hypothetical protein